MKRSILFSVFFLIGLGLVFSQSINVTSPSGGDTWVKGDTPTINWTKSGTMDANVKITLRNTDGSLHTVITMSTPNDGSYPWTVPVSIPNGSYLMRVKTVDNAVTDDSPAFTIAGAGAASIAVTDPGTGDQLCEGDPFTITWSKSGTMDANVKLTLRNADGSLHSVITMSTPNDGNYPWTVPASLSNGDYRIRVKTVDNAVTDDGDQFTVKVCDSGTSSSCSKFVITKPAKGAVYWKGFPIEIKWKKKIQVLPGTFQAQKAVQKLPQRKLIKPELDKSILKMVKIEIKSVKCMSVVQMRHKLEGMYATKQLSVEKIKQMMDIPWLVELLKWKTIKAVTADDGSFTWTGSGAFKKGCYVIRITKLWCDASDSDRVATSEKFSIIPIQFPDWAIKKLKEKTKAVAEIKD